MARTASFCSLLLLCNLHLLMLLALGRRTTSTAAAASFVFRTTGRSALVPGAALFHTTSTGGMPSSRELAEERRRRRAVASGTRRLRDESVRRTTERNYHLRSVLHNQQTAAAAAAVEDPSSTQFYQVKVTVDEELRQELKLSGREKRGRVFLERDSDAVATVKGLKRELHGFFRALRKDTYLLKAGYPVVAPDGKVLAQHAEDDSNARTPPHYWPIETDDDVALTFERARQFYDDHWRSGDGALKRPAIVVHVSEHPDAPKPPPPPAYLEGMPDPAESTHMTMLSFYGFPVGGIEDPEALADELRRLWKPFQALGRVYVAHEGINAQMSVPTNVLDRFVTCCRRLPAGVGESLENGINADPVPLTRGEFAAAGGPAASSGGGAAPPFRGLHVRVRRQIVADGLDRSYDWRSAGYDMPPLEWHERLKRAKGDDVTLLDCRNTYETDVGLFEGAEPLDTQNFRDSWNALEKKLEGKPKDTPIYTYCTGGIRCVKVGAYLTQELGFTNVNRLAGGIIAYDRTLREEKPEEEPLFKGTNFVFDGRLGRPITEDALGTCVTCGAETSLVSNCRNGNCHQRIIQCEACRTAYQGTCSEACRRRLVNGAVKPRRGVNGDVASPQADVSATTDSLPQFDTIDGYSSGHSSPIPSIYPEMEFNTRALIPCGSHMVSGSAQGRLLAQFASMTREGRVLELGTFTGYATACLLEGAVKAGRAADLRRGSREGGPFVMTMERDAKAFDVAVAQMKVVAEHGADGGTDAAEAMCALRSVGSVPVRTEDVVSLRDASGIAGCELVKVTDALAVLEEMAAGRGDMRPAPFDMVFVDADKTRLIEYADACLSSDRVLKPGGLIVVDNVLWKGLVLEASRGEFSSIRDFEDTEEAELRKNRRARKLANKMHRFNSEIVKDDRAEVLMLPLRDGLSVIRKK